ncbi:hypothetical protein QYE73_22730 [Pseudomonas mosselii]|uniref:hypothetical protein n=1 Tax=Pseudomonas mosselii TaxID=78327 RepID=UPI0026115BB4|nr:hypothetical protein [Pseudomonas mosselii]MDN4500107.1 hypothetical protein [Pseudomonas mosselii]
MADHTTIALRSLDRAFVDMVRVRTGESSGSKAFIEAAHQFLQQGIRIEELVTRVQELDAEVLRLYMQLQNKKLVFEQLAPLCIQVAEIAGQAELFE